MDGLPSTIDRVRRLLAALAGATALMAAAPMATSAANRQAPPSPPAAADAVRVRLAARQREATALLMRGARPDTPGETKRASWREAADRLRTLGAEPAGLFMRRSPINNVDLSLSKIFGGPTSLKFEVRIDAFNALNHTQFTGFNGTANFANLTDTTITNPAINPTTGASNFTGFGSVSGVAAPRTLQLVTRVTF